MEELENLTGQKYHEIRIVGGGCRDRYLNRLTAERAARKVCAGPVEATAIGNLIAQLLGTGKIRSVKEAKEIISRSFEIAVFE